MDEDATWYGSRPLRRPHCIRRVPSAPRKGHSTTPSFRPMSIVATVAHLSYCWAASRHHLGFLKFENFNGRTGQEYWTASSCQISWLSLELLLRHSDFSIFQDGGGGFLKCQMFNGRTAQEGGTALMCHISSKSVKSLPWYGDFSETTYRGNRLELRCVRPSVRPQKSFFPISI